MEDQGSILGPYHGLNCVLSNSHIEALTPYLGMWLCLEPAPEKRGLTWKEAVMVVPNPIWLAFLLEEGIQRPRDTTGTGTGTQRKDRVRTQRVDGPSASQEERPQEKAILLKPWSWMSSLQNPKKISFCCWSPPSLWWFVTATQWTDTDIFSSLSASAHHLSDFITSRGSNHHLFADKSPSSM